MTPPTRPKVVHVYRSDGPNPLWIDQHCTAPYPDPTHRLCRGEYLGEYVPAPGPVVAERWEVRYLADSGRWRLDSSHDDDHKDAHVDRVNREDMDEDERDGLLEHQDYKCNYELVPNLTVINAAELARLRRMADAYATWNVTLDQRPTKCGECGATPNGIHTATCDVAAHLGLPREGDGL